MEPNWINIATDIANAVAALTEKINSKKNAAEIITRSALQAGIHDYFKFIYKNAEIQLYSSDLTYSTAELHYKAADISAVQITEENVKILTPLLHEALEKVIAPYDQLPILDHTINIEGQIISGKTKLNIPAYTHTSEPKREQLLQKISRYLEQKVDNGKYPTKELDTFFLSKHLVNTNLYPALDHAYIIRVFDTITELNKNDEENLKEHQHHINYALRCWAEEDFLPRYYDTTEGRWEYTHTLQQSPPTPDEGLIDLLIYSAIRTIKLEANYQRSTSVNYLEMASKLGSSKATQILQSGTGQFQAFSTPDVVIIPNDVSATVEIQIIREEEQAYVTATEQITQLLQNGFLHSYSIQLQSATKKYLSIEGLAKTDTHHFFANALQYPGLHGLLATYARQAMSIPDEWYTDAEDEFCCLPGTYAVFGLGLTGSTYFPLVQEYMKQVDTEHQSVQYQFTQDFIKKYGSSPETIPTIVACLLACQSEGPFQQLTTMDSDSLSALLTELTGKESYEARNVLELIWGDIEDLDAAAKKKDAPSQLPELLKLTEEE